MNTRKLTAFLLLICLIGMATVQAGPKSKKKLMDQVSEPVDEAPVGGGAGSRADDADGDRAVDAVDNCLNHANPGQRDTDVDGYGNRCDADFDQNGVVDEEDQLRLEAVLFTGVADPQPQILDLNDNGEVDDGDLEILYELLGSAPGPRQDIDGDGTDDVEDRCHDTPPGAMILGKGCSPLDAMQAPEDVTDPLADRVQGLADELRGDDMLFEVVSFLDESMQMIQDGTAMTQGGDPCAAGDYLMLAGELMGSAGAELQVRIQEATDAAPPGDRTDEDAVPEDVAIIMLLFRQDEINDAQAEAAEVRGVFDMLCAEARPYPATGVAETVVDVDDAGRRLQLEDGRILGHSGLGDMDTAPGPGSAVVVNQGYEFADATAFTFDLTAEVMDQNFTWIPCVEPRFAPIQRFGDWGGAGPYELLHPDAYELNGKYRLERDMRIAAEKVCPSDNFTPIFTRYSLKLTILYYLSPSQTTPFKNVIASDLAHGDEPVPIPSTYWNTNNYDRITLRVETMKRNCSLVSFPNISCSGPVKIKEADYPISRKARGSQCVASYYQTDFAINDQDPNAWTQTWINNVVHIFPSDTPVEFRGRGYEMCPKSGGGWKPCNNFSTIFSNHSFVLRSWDLYPVGPQPDTNAQKLLYEILGVENSAGLQWPRLRGTRNGHTWQFSCKLPRVIRDHVNFCAGGTDAFYRMPFAEGEVWTLTQGNFSPPGNSHDSGYAYDMAGNCGSGIRASRAGRVQNVRTGSNCMKHANCTSAPQCGSSCCTSAEINNGLQWGNAVWVKHQDESTVVYLHMKPGNGVVVQKGQWLQRGELIGRVGTSGRSSGPHLHFAARDLNGTNELALFQAWNFPLLTQKNTCWEPSAGAALLSDNKKKP